MSDTYYQAMKTHFLNVGNGDCTVIELPDGALMVIDIMNARIFDSRSEFANPLQYIKQLRPSETKIHRYIQTHPDMDHMDGLSDLLQEFSITNFWDTKNNRPDPEKYTNNFRPQDWNEYKRIRNTDNAKFFTRSVDKIVHTGGEYIYDLYALNPSEDLVTTANNSEAWNLLSHITLLEYKGFKLLASGDADDVSWTDLYNWTLTNPKAKSLLSNVTVFKAAHHGRNSSYCGFDMLNTISPQCIVISHDSEPADESAKSRYKDFLEQKGRNLYETSNGNIVVQWDDEQQSGTVKQTPILYNV